MPIKIISSILMACIILVVQWLPVHYILLAHKDAAGHNVLQIEVNSLNYGSKQAELNGCVYCIVGIQINVICHSTFRR